MGTRGRKYKSGAPLSLKADGDRTLENRHFYREADLLSLAGDWAANRPGPTG